MTMYHCLTTSSVLCENKFDKFYVDVELSYENGLALNTNNKICFLGIPNCGIHAHYTDTIRIVIHTTTLMLAFRLFCLYCVKVCSTSIQLHAYTAKYTLYTVQFTLYTVHCTVCVHSAHYIVCTIYNAVSVWTLHSVKCTILTLSVHIHL